MYVPCGGGSQMGHGGHRGTSTRVRGDHGGGAAWWWWLARHVTGVTLTCRPRPMQRDGGQVTERGGEGHGSKGTVGGAWDSPLWPWWPRSDGGWGGVAGVTSLAQRERSERAAARMEGGMQAGGMQAGRHAGKTGVSMGGV